MIRKKQCRSKHFAGGKRCQGVLGHKEHHWYYSLTGGLWQWRDRKGLKPYDWASSYTPPDHHNYIHPKDMISARSNMFE